MNINRMHSHQQAKLNNLEMRKSTSLELISNSASHMEYLIGILKCPICSAQVKHAHMCPSCCRLFCQMCIKNSIVYKKAQCPCCFKPLRYTAPINCQALAIQIQQAINKTVSNFNVSFDAKQTQSLFNSKAMSCAYSTPDLNSQQSRISYNNSTTTSSMVALCQEHQLKLEYYCETCSTGICSDCAVLGNKHQNHKLCKFSQKRVHFQQKITGLIKNIANFKNQLLKKRQQKLIKVQNIKMVERQKKQALLNHLKKSSDSAIMKLTRTMTQKAQNELKQKQNFEQYNQLLRKYQNSVYGSQKVGLINKFVSLRSQIQNIVYNKIVIDTKRKQPLQNQFAPSFGSKTFILDNYTYLRQKGDLLYSQPLFWKGIQWKLRIFPGGTQDKSSTQQTQKYLAIYLEMAKGHHSPNIYKYQILLINQVDRSKAIGCTFQNQFQEGTYWGLDRFANINFLYSEKFIHPIHGYLQIVLNVRSPSYFNATKDQTYFIVQKLSQIKQKNKQLKQLRKKAGVKIFKNLKTDRNRLSIKALVDYQQKTSPKQKRTRSCPKPGFVQI